ncbi:hypothetical protein SAMN05216593_10511 [Pseudomonas asturiensis]|uniref:DUF7256 domain-containing protein n=1 Tax=Pseudomonas asturiensis TaxID=1190415 RepID=A0A1M7N016_9PSED|nr:hypothetical protein [Pseudomonas asturiensis]SHM96290.1 hypothetical protein SAMN05216593_10511 [Pseudomonas asturiensis]
MNVAKIVALRPGMPKDALDGLTGEYGLSFSESGYLLGVHDLGYGARVDAQGVLGTVSFYRSFPREQLIERLHIGMPLAEAQTARPDMKPAAGGPDDPPEWLTFKDRTDDAFELLVRVTENRILAIEISKPGAIYPEPVKLLADPSLTVAYDLVRDPQQRLPATGRGAEWSGGWSLGLPPGITTEQWPLSPIMGHPLRHAFTLYVPQPYRKQGAERVAFCLFVDDQMEELSPSSEVEDFFDSPLLSTPPDDEALLPFWTHRHARHASHFDMTDILGTHYVAIWLTQAEFDGALCNPPDLRDNPLLTGTPGWLDKSYADHYRYATVRNHDAEAYSWLAGEGCAAGLDTAFAIKAQVREDDPNVGKPPREWDDECEHSGYIRPYVTEEGEALGLDRFANRNHLGGTMYPVQGYPEFGPYYLEFEEDFGGFNFGSGNCQIDLEKMELDWAC